MTDDRQEETLEQLLARAQAAFEALSPEEQAAHRAEQRASWVRGELAMGESSAATHQLSPAELMQRPAQFVYLNHEGRSAMRTVSPLRIWHGKTDWHPEPTWLLAAWDHDREAERDFALDHIGPRAEQTARIQARVADVLGPLQEAESSGTASVLAMRVRALLAAIQAGDIDLAGAQ